jgi:hypothetical protein
MNRVNKVFGAMSLAMMLVACGGGSSGNNATSAASEVDPELAAAGATEGAQAVGDSAYYTARPITVTVTGPGMVGNMVSGVLGPMNCGNGGTVCSVKYTKYTSVLLGALPNTGMVFLGWGGACSGTANTCTLNNSQSRAVTAKFGPAGTTTPPTTPTTYRLNVSTSGSGTVASGAGGINCGADCSEDVTPNAAVTLIATPAAGFKLSAWGGDCSGSASTCSITMSQARDVSAAFVVADTTAPTVASATPGAGATDVAVTTPVKVTFSKTLDCSTVSGQTFKVGSVSGTIACSGNTATFTPVAALSTAAQYPVALTAGTSGIKDTAGNALAGTTSWNFTTAAAATTPPVTPPTTPPATGGAFSFLAYGDSRSGNGCGGNAVHIGLVNRMVNEPAAFVFNLGDMVTGYDKSTNWVQRGDCPSDASKGSFKEIIAPLQNKTPAAGLQTYYFPVVGNHDDNYGDGWYPDKFGNGYCDVFDPKKVGIPNHTQNKAYFKDWTTSSVKHYTDDQFYQLACAKTRSGVYPDYMYYSFDYKGTHFVVLRLNSDYYDVMECSSNCTAANEGNYDAYYYKHQLDWLRYDLAQASANSAIQNTIVLMHAPLISYSDGHAPNASWPTLIKDFSKHPKVKMVISGHSHVYERSVPVFADDANPNGVRDDSKGAVYTVTGGGGSALAGFNKVGTLNAKATAAYHYMRIDVDGGKVNVKTIGQDGAVLDTFSTR